MASIIGLSGGSGSGKTRFIEFLKKRCTNLPVTFISLDDYYYPKEQQKVDDKGVTNFDLPTSIDIESLVKDLDKLSNNIAVEKEEYTFNNRDNKGETKIYQPNPVIFVEGLFLYYYPELKPYLDVKLFVHAEDDIKIQRRIDRDSRERNYPLEDVIYRYKNHVLPSFKKFMEPFIGEMDLVINNNTDFEKGLDIIFAYTESLLKK